MTTFILGVIIVLFGLVVIIPLAVLFCYNAAKQKKQASLVAEATIEFVTSGETCTKVMANVPGYHYCSGACTYEVEVGKESDGTHNNLDGSVVPKGTWFLTKKPVQVTDALLPTTEKNYEPWSIDRYLRKKWGFFWAAWTYPYTKVHEFEIRKSRLNRDWKAGDPLDKMVQVDKDPVSVHELRWRIARAITVDDVECSDRLQVSLGVVFNLQVVMPKLPVFVNKGGFFSEVESLIRTAIISYCATVKLEEFLAKTKVGPDSDFFARVISHVNEEMLRRYGVVVISAWIVDIVNKRQELLEAQEQARLSGEANVLTAKLAAEAAYWRADGEAKAITVVANAEANAIRVRGEAESEVLVAQFTGTSEATVIEALRRKGLAEYNGQALSLGGGGGQIVQLAPPAVPKPADKSSSGGAESDPKTGKTGVKNTP